MSSLADETRWMDATDQAALVAKGEVTPGELLTVEASVVHEGSGYAITEAKVKVGGKLRSNATLTFSHIPFPNPDLRGHMEAVAKRVGFPSQAIA